MYKEITSLDSDFTTALGGINKKTKKANPTSVEGYYLGSRTVESKNGPALLHFFQTSKGNVGVWGKTDLDRKLSQVTVGQMTKATFVKMKKVPGKNDMYVYRVESDADNSIEVSSETVEEVSEELSAQDTDDTITEEETYEEDEDTSSDEVTPARPARGNALPPSLASQQKVKDLLSKVRSKTA